MHALSAILHERPLRPGLQITSAFPNSGAMYHWVGQLVPPRWAPLASYATGTLLLFGNVCNIAISAAGCAGWIGAIITSQSGADETPSAGATVGLTLAIVAAWAAINLQHITSLAWCYCAFAALHVLVALALVVTAYAITAPQGGGDPWTQWVNASGFSGGYAVMLSISSAIYSLAGYDVRAGVGGSATLRFGCHQICYSHLLRAGGRPSRRGNALC